MVPLHPDTHLRICTDTDLSVSPSNSTAAAFQHAFPELMYHNVRSTLHQELCDRVDVCGRSFHPDSLLDLGEKDT